MNEYRIVSRGEGLLEWFAAGHFHPSYLVDLLDHTALPLLDHIELDKLRAFLSNPSPSDRWNAARKFEGLRLASLVSASGPDVLLPAVKDMLIAHLSGQSLRGRGRPLKRIARSNDAALLVKFIKEHVAVCLTEGKPLIVPFWGEVIEERGWRDLPVAERSMRIAYKAVRDRGHRVPSIRTMRNKLPKQTTLGIIS